VVQGIEGRHAIQTADNGSCTHEGRIALASVITAYGKEAYLDIPQPITSGMQPEGMTSV
jgi:hypothetical protein